MKKDYLKIAGNVHLARYIEAADKLGIKFEVIIPSLSARFEHNGNHWFINNTATPLTNSPSATLAKRKHLTNLILANADLPVPVMAKLDSEKAAIDFYNKQKDIVIKPVQQLGGKGITILPETEDAVSKAYKFAKEKDLSKTSFKVLGEEFYDGENYRILAVGNKAVGIVRRKAAHVVGDGTKTINQLIKAENAERKEDVMMPIIIDAETEHKLKTQGLTLDSVPKNNEEVVLRFNCNLSTGGTTEECSAETDEYYKELAVKALAALDLEFGGVDIITPDISSPAKCAINEVNYNPGLRLHYMADKGERVPVAIPVMEYMRDKYSKK